MFNKKVKEEEIEELDFSKKEDEVEIFDLNEETPMKRAERKKETRVLIIIIGIIIVFVLLLPTIKGYFTTPSVVRTITSGEITSNNTNDGFLTIGSSEGNIIARKVQFYSFEKRENNSISFTYLSESSIDDVSKSNLYIELYNSSKNLVYREKFVPSSTKLERKQNSSYSMNLLATIYGESTYAKINILEDKDFAISSTTLTCNKTENNVANIKNTMVFTFSTNGLVSYIIERSASINDEDNTLESDSEEVKEENVFASEYNKLLDSSVSDITYEKNYIKYNVKLLEVSDFDVLYELASTPRQVKLDLESKNWSCR